MLPGDILLCKAFSMAKPFQVAGAEKKAAEKAAEKAEKTTEKAKRKRLIVNPEFVESLDQGDGSQQYDGEEEQYDD